MEGLLLQPLLAEPPLPKEGNQALVGTRVGAEDCCELQSTWLAVARVCCRPLIGVLLYSQGHPDTDAKPAAGRPLGPGASMILR